MIAYSIFVLLYFTVHIPLARSRYQTNLCIYISLMEILCGIECFNSTNKTIVTSDTSKDFFDFVPNQTIVLTNTDSSTNNATYTISSVIISCHIIYN